MVEEYKNTQGYCCFFIGKWNNYGLWDGAETENIPLEDRDQRLDMLFTSF
jgi:hypothetical protein